MRSAEGDEQRESGLKHDPDHARIRLLGPKRERLQIQVLFFLFLSYLFPKVEGVGDEESKTQQRLEGKCNQAEHEFDDEDQEEPGLIPTETPAVKGQCRRPMPIAI